MCRWMAWRGQPLYLEELLFAPQHSLVDQSLHSRMGVETTNGDGFGVGWYGTGEGPGVYRSIAPAWGDPNLRRLAGQIESPLFLAHVRATTGTAIQETNCHPFSHGNWLMVHNGVINDFHVIKRDLMLALDDESFAAIEGSTDSEVLFHLARTLGLERDPIDGLAAAIGFAEETLRRHGIEPAVQASIGVSDGEHLWAVRYSSNGPARTLFTSVEADAARKLDPDNPRLQRFRDGDRIVVSEPIADLPGAWLEIEEDSALIVHADGNHEMRSFTPRVPALQE